MTCETKSQTTPPLHVEVNDIQQKSENAWKTKFSKKRQTLR